MSILPLSKFVDFAQVLCMARCAGVFIQPIPASHDLEEVDSIGPIGASSIIWKMEMLRISNMNFVLTLEDLKFQVHEIECDDSYVTNEIKDQRKLLSIGRGHIYVQFPRDAPN